MVNPSENPLPKVGIVIPSKELPLNKLYEDYEVTPLEYFIKNFTPDWPGSFAVVYHHTILRAERRPEAEPEKRRGESRYKLQTPFPDPFAILNLLAKMTNHAELYTAVLVAPQMQTADLAQKAAAIANLSKGRFRMGVGVGWNEPEYNALGKGDLYHHRGKVLNKQIPALRKLLTGQVFSGQISPRENLDQMAINPGSNYNVPIMVGGQSEAALERAAYLGDGWLPLGESEEFKKQVKLVNELLRKAGKDIAKFTTMGRIAIGKTPINKWVDEYLKWQDVGATHVTLTTTGDEDEYDPNGEETDPHHHSRMIAKFLRLTSWLRTPIGSFSGLFAEPYSGDVLQLDEKLKNYKSMKLDKNLKIDHVIKFLLSRGFAETAIKQFTIQGKQIGLNVVSQTKGLIGPNGIKLIFMNQENDPESIFLIYDKEIELGFGNWHNFKQ